MKTVYAILIAALLASTASATYYLDERFEGSQFPPAGWELLATTHANWYQQSGPPPDGAYAFGYASTPETRDATAYANLVAPSFILPAPGTLYYRFRYTTTATTRALPGRSVAGEFYLYYVDTSEPLVDLIFDDVIYTWEEATGSTPAAGGRAIRAAWRVEYGLTIPGAFIFCVDTCQVNDEPMTAATPASLGRVKALFR